MKGHHLVRCRGRVEVIDLARQCSFSWQPGPDHTVLILTSQKGHQVRFGVPHQAPTAEISAVLTSHQLIHEHDWSESFDKLAARNQQEAMGSDPG